MNTTTRPPTTRPPMAYRRAAEAAAYKAWLRSENGHDIATFLLGCAWTTICCMGLLAMFGVHP